MVLKGAIAVFKDQNEKRADIERLFNDNRWKQQAGRLIKWKGNDKAVGAAVFARCRK